MIYIRNVWGYSIYKGSAQIGCAVGNHAAMLQANGINPNLCKRRFIFK